MDTNRNSALDKKSFQKLKKIAPNLLAARRSGDSQRLPTRELPDEIAFKLTNRCDLRCDHCYQWNESGYHHALPPEAGRSDLPLALIKKVLNATRETRSNVYLWGGEPLLYRDWNDLVNLLKEDPRWTSLCTNGTQIEKKIDSLIHISENLEVSVSLDGFEADHDAIRGAGAFQKAIGGIRLLVKKKRASEYKGEITANCVLTDKLLDRLIDFISFLEHESVETLYISFPWFLSADACSKMDRYYSDHVKLLTNGQRPSWYSYNYQLSSERKESIIETIEAINSQPWKIKIRYNPELPANDIANFLSGSDQPANNKKSCQSIHTRMDVFPNGDVISCKFFPEFSMGNIQERSVESVWKGPEFSKHRDTLSRCGLMPACAKCNLLYTRGG